MKALKTKNLIPIIAFLSVILFLTVLVGLVDVNNTASANIEIDTEYRGAYRNQLAFSAKSGWNNDPNGLLYVGNTWHMYYQYNYDQRVTDGKYTALGWGNMSWGHATSTDLVHWTEQPVAIPAYQEVDGTQYDMMFSGSAVYDEYNTSGLFDMVDGKIAAGQGIVAILTQPTDKQRQILAYSKDNGNTFKIYGEVIGADEDGGVGDNEFRDPKVFWNDTLGKWIAVIGGGSIRMYSSSNLIEWEYLGETGYWGECPDISRYTVDGEQKYVLIMSPEDKDNSHIYNRTTRESAYYPAEYYVVGDLDEKGLFISDEPVRRLSEGIDSYAMQTFNNAPDGKVYGVSWAASWKTCGLYENIRKTYNGGMTVVTELNLVKDGEGYALTRKPVEGYEELRSETLKTYSDTLKEGENALAGVKTDVGDIELELDFSNSKATYAELWLRTSAVEKIKLAYNVKDETLTLDRSQSSLLAKDTSLYSAPYSKHVALNDGKLSLRVLLDRAFISVFADEGKASFFSAVFPSAISNGMRLFADGDIGVKANVYKLDGIFDIVEDNALILSTKKIDGTVGSTYPVTATFFGDGFDESKVNYEITEGSGKIRIAQVGCIAYITLLKNEKLDNTADSAKVKVSYEGFSDVIEIYIYNDRFSSDVDYKYNVGGFSYYGDNGLFLSEMGGDAFRFADVEGESFIYSAEFAPRSAEAQAAGLVFGVSDNLTAYYVATVDAKLDKVKLWAPGSGELKTVNYQIEDGRKVKLTLVVNEGIAKIFVNNETIAQLVCKLPDYHGGKLGLNVYKGEFDINKVRFARTERGNGIFVNGYKVKSVYNLTDNNYKLQEGEYVEQGGAVALSESYLRTLGAGEIYRFRVVTEFTDLEFDVTPDFVEVTVSPSIEKYYKNNDVMIELAGQAKVNRLTIDGVDTEFTQSEAGDIVVIAAEKIALLSMGKHTVKLYTDAGRPEVVINISQAVETIAEPVVKATHLFFYIDIAIFGSVIVGYIVIMVIKKYKKKPAGKKADK